MINIATFEYLTNEYAVICCHPSLPEHHHVHGVVSEAGDQRCQRDDKYDREKEMWAAVWTGSWLSVTLAPRYTPAVGI